jgi:hypothetical protein
MILPFEHVHASLRSALFGAMIAVSCVVPSHLAAVTHWHSISTLHCNIRYPTGMDELGLLTADLIEDSYNEVSDFLGHDIRRTIAVEVWPAHQGPDFADTCSGGDGIRTAFFQNACRMTVTYPGSPSTFRHTLIHGITGVIIYDMFSDEQVPVPGIRACPMPGFFAESLAVYISNIERNADMRPAGQMKLNDFPGMYSLTGETGLSVNDGRIEGAGIIAYLDASTGRSVIGEIFRDVRDIGNFTDALRIATGKEYSTLRDDTAAFLKGSNLYGGGGPDPDRGRVIITVEETSSRAFNLFPAVAPEGNRIAYLAAGRRKSVLRIASIPGGANGSISGVTHSTTIGLTYTEGSFCAVDNRLTWTGDGRRLMAAGSHKGSEAILFIDPATGRLDIAVRMPFSAVMFPALSADEKHIVFSGIASVSADIYIYNMISGSMARLTDDAFMDRDPVMSPDGRNVIFATNWNAAGDQLRGSYDIIRQNIQSGKREVLVSNGCINIQPALSTDGARMLYVSNINGEFAIYSLDLKTGKTQELTDARTSALYPAWFPAGSAIAYVCSGMKGSDIRIGAGGITGR